MDLDDWRARMDDLNLRLLEVLKARMECSLAIAKLKRDKGLPIFDPVREKNMFESLLAKNPGPLPDEALLRIFEAIVSESRRLQETAPAAGDP